MVPSLFAFVMVPSFAVLMTACFVQDSVNENLDSTALETCLETVIDVYFFLESQSWIHSAARWRPACAQALVPPHRDRRVRWASIITGTQR